MIRGERIEEILKKPALQNGLQSYKFIMERLHRTDVSADKEFQVAFRNFYQMRRFYSDEFARHYFRLMEQMKDSRNMSFKMALERIKHIQNTYEMSFSSKMMHTINPFHPIWDSVVTKKHFGISAPYVKKNREEVAVTDMICMRTDSMIIWRQKKGYRSSICLMSIFRIRESQI